MREIVMKKILRVFAVAVCLAVGTDAVAVAVTVKYDHAGLTQIEIESGRLHYVWHTQRKFGAGEPAPMRQDMSNYDRHEVVIWLTGEEFVSVTKWIQMRKVLDLPAKYPAKADKTYGSAFQTSLTAVLEDRKNSIGWDGDSIVTEDLRTAEKELLNLCDRIRKDREQ
jgi:hypothetical protein